MDKVRKEGRKRNILKGFQMAVVGQEHEEEKQVEVSQETYSNTIQLSMKRIESMEKRIKELEEKAQECSKKVTI